MSSDNINNFLKVIDENTALQAKFREVLSHVTSEGGRSIADKVAAISVEAGTPFTAEEFLDSHSAENTEELTESELGSVAGGEWESLSQLTRRGPACNYF